VPVDRRRPEIVALEPGVPDVPTLFTFMRDAELRFQTLRMRLEERTWTTRGEHLTVTTLVLRHPGWARVTTTEPERGPRANYEVWISDGETVRTYSAPRRVGTVRPVRHSVRGLDDPDFPGMSRVYVPLTPLPMETLPDVFVHPAGFCQNVLATGRCWVSGVDEILDREVVFVECATPRTVEVVADRPDFHIRIAVDRETGVILREVETIGDRITRWAEVTSFEPDVELPPDIFDFEFPTGTRILF
jgi:outer membrane lipoprotein-sorting protein